MARSNTRQAEPAAPAIVGAKKSGRTVTVACNIPNGLRLRLCRPMRTMEQTQAGPREVTIFHPEGNTVIVAGPAYPVQPPKGYPRQKPIEGAYALTAGIDADFWDQWIEQNKLNDLVKNRAIFASPAAEDVTAEARENEKRRSGFEPLVMGENQTDYRMPKPTNPNVMFTDPGIKAA